MRAGYGFMGIGLATVKWPLLLEAESAPLFEGIVTCLLTAMSLLALLGLRYPVRMLPVLLFEVMWKVLWLGLVALPTAVSGTVSTAMAEVVVNCALVVVVAAVVPWRYVWQRFGAAAGDPWKTTHPAPHMW
jgi:hypothetical protein